MEEDLDILEKALLKLEATESKERTLNDHEILYKNCGRLGNQEERRMRILEIQKCNRHNKIDRFRGIFNLPKSQNENDGSKIFKPFKKVDYRPNIYVAGFNKTCYKYNNVMMLSEWMIDKPHDFSKNWYVVPCPKGMRLLAIANNGTTKFYSKYGIFKFELPTGLPGGNPYNCVRRNSCILDCFYHESSQTIYLLDLLAWNDQPMTDGETEFRYYWMKTQLEDFPDTKTINKKNKLIIKILPMLPCSNHYLTFLLSTYPHFEFNTPSLDGLLFYHKKAHYFAGETPLVGWLYPFMVNEVLGSDILVHPGYYDDMPDDYVNQADFIQKFEKQNEKKNKNRLKKKKQNDSEANNNEETNETNSMTMEEDQNEDHNEQDQNEEEKCDKEKEVIEGMD